jgi:transposase|tara:strand:+ start:113 stop:1117 length:1005 start_codon:yes stop_codon:yes gene_type:complete
MKFVTPLRDTEVQTLEQCHKNHNNRRVCRRAHSILLSASGYQRKEIAQIYSVDKRTISSWIDRWENNGIAGLSDKPRDGRPEKLTAAEQQQVIDFVLKTPKNLKSVAATVAKETHKTVSRQTIKRIAKKKRFVYKRIKKAPAKQPTEKQLSRGKEMIARLQQQEKAGIIDLRYFDATGFCLEPVIPYAWQPIGQTLTVPSAKSRRVNVLGFLNRENQLFPCLIEGTVDSSVVIACFDAFAKTIEQKTVVLIDNAPIHRSHRFIAAIGRWVKQGLIVKFLPPYSPQLNLIEILWRMMKYSWLPLEAYICLKNLVKAVEEILARYGEAYQITFQAA